MVIITYSNGSIWNLDSVEKKECIFSVKRILGQIFIIIITRMYSHQYYNISLMTLKQVIYMDKCDRQLLIVVEYM